MITAIEQAERDKLMREKRFGPQVVIKGVEEAFGSTDLNNYDLFAAICAALFDAGYELLEKDEDHLDKLEDLRAISEAQIEPIDNNQ
jgi:hypothetical protein